MTNATGLHDVAEGDIVTLSGQGRHRGGMARVTKVGRRWVHTTGGFQFDRDTGRSKDSTGSGIYAYSVEQYEDRERAIALGRELRDSGIRLGDIGMPLKRHDGTRLTDLETRALQLDLIKTARTHGLLPPEGSA